MTSGLRALRSMQDAPPLVCANCGKYPDEHNVSALDRLTCRDRSGREWRYTDDRRAWDLMRQLDETDARQSRLRTELFLLVEPHL